MKKTNAHSGERIVMSGYNALLAYIEEKSGSDYLPLYSQLELYVINDMRNKGFDYPFIGVDAVETYWKERLS